MTDLEKQLEDVKQKQREAVEKANQLAQQRQEVMQEVLKLAGEQRLLERLIIAAKNQPVKH